METILKHMKTITVTAIFCWISYNTYAQKETELFIPIGQSPGVSGKLSVVGRLGTIDLRDSAVSLLQEPGDMKNFRINYRTAIYLDRSKLKLTNTIGTLADVKPGLMAEVKYMDNKPGSIMAEWIKVQLE